MGYYDVAIGMSIKSFRELWEYEKELVDEQGSLLDNISKFIMKKDGTVLLFWHDVCWRRHPSADRIEEFLHNLMLDRKRAYTFTIMGEDLNDIEEYYCCGEEEPDYIEYFGVKREIILTGEDKDDEQWTFPEKNQLEKL